MHSVYISLLLNEHFKFALITQSFSETIIQKWTTSSSSVWDGTISRPTWSPPSNIWGMRSHFVTLPWPATDRDARTTRWFCPPAPPTSRLCSRRTPLNTRSSSWRTSPFSTWQPFSNSCMPERSMSHRYAKLWLAHKCLFTIKYAFQDQLPQFLKTAERLKVKGLAEAPQSVKDE